MAGINGQAYLQLMRINRPIGILLLLWPTLIALWIAAEGVPDLTILMIFIAGVIVMRSAGCVINDIADRHVDGAVSRTAQRPLATGAVSTKHAISLFVVLCLLAFGLVLLLNKYTISLSIGALILATIYPFMKRYTHFPQVVLGAAFGWAIPMAFAAQTNAVPMIAWVLFVANILWSVIYDTFYAMVDRDDDVKIGVKSTAVLFGQYDRVITAALQLCLIGLLTAIGWTLSFTIPYWLAVTISAGLFAYQQRLIRTRDRAACLQAFLNNNGVGAVLFIGVAGHYMLSI